MAAWTRAEVRQIAPEMAAPAVSDATIDAFVVIAERRINECLYGDTLIDAGAYLTAHLLKMAGYGSGAGGAGTVGPVTGVTVGQVSKTHAAPSVGTWWKTDPSLLLTRYGLMYASYEARTLPGAMVL